MRFLAFSFLITFFACQQAATPTVEEKMVETKQNLPPDERFGELFREAQMQKVFPDGKTFVDMNPKYTTEEILKNYELAKTDETFNLKGFITNNFDLPPSISSDFESDTTKSVAEHINSLWPVLTRQPDEEDTGTLLEMPNAYIVPGGRFREVYYWDSYFTMLGLEVADRVDMIENMVDNFAYLIDEIGFIPNGNRTYYLGRSQPPFYASMVNLLANAEGKDKNATLQKYLPSLEKEYQFWMTGEEQVLKKEADAVGKVVRLPDGSILNRYYDKFDTPRPESYREDVETAEESDLPEAEAYRHLRSGAESGWDYTTRWFADGENISTIETTNIIPVDLNSLLYNLEKTISEAQTAAGNTEQAEIYQQKATQRAQAIENYLWDEAGGFYGDYNFVNNKLTGIPSLAMMYPLFYQLAQEDRAAQVAKVIEKDFLKAGGVVTTLNHSGQQWDAPNGWAPLQWITIQGLRNYDQAEISNTIRDRWIDVNTRVYKNVGKMVEKYNVEDMTLEAGGGEYPVQDGFGWSNGVLLKLLSEKK
ncbi:MAG: alpha,alpha-trehalase TreF [Saprospiraceae bacterium]